jgi:hypothetical protein
MKNGSQLKYLFSEDYILLGCDAVEYDSYQCFGES